MQLLRPPFYGSVVSVLVGAIAFFMGAPSLVVFGAGIVTIILLVVSIVFGYLKSRNEDDFWETKDDDATNSSANAPETSKTNDNFGKENSNDDQFSQDPYLMPVGAVAQPEAVNDPYAPPSGFPVGNEAVAPNNSPFSEQTPTPTENSENFGASGFESPADNSQEVKTLSKKELKQQAKAAKQAAKQAEKAAKSEAKEAEKSSSTKTSRFASITGVFNRKKDEAPAPEESFPGDPTNFNAQIVEASAVESETEDPFAYKAPAYHENVQEAVVPSPETVTPVAEEFAYEEPVAVETTAVEAPVEVPVETQADGNAQQEPTKKGSSWRGKLANYRAERAGDKADAADRDDRDIVGWLHELKEDTLQASSENEQNAAEGDELVSSVDNDPNFHIPFTPVEAPAVDTAEETAPTEALTAAEPNVEAAPLVENEVSEETPQAPKPLPGTPSAGVRMPSLPVDLGEPSDSLVEETPAASALPEVDEASEESATLEEPVQPVSLNGLEGPVFVGESIAGEEADVEEPVALSEPIALEPVVLEPVVLESLEEEPPVEEPLTDLTESDAVVEEVSAETEESVPTVEDVTVPEVAEDAEVESDSDWVDRLVNIAFPDVDDEDAAITEDAIMVEQVEPVSVDPVEDEPVEDSREDEYVPRLSPEGMGLKSPVIPMSSGENNTTSNESEGNTMSTHTDSAEAVHEPQTVVPIGNAVEKKANSEPVVISDPKVAALASQIAMMLAETEYEAQRRAEEQVEITKGEGEKRLREAQEDFDLQLQETRRQVEAEAKVARIDAERRAEAAASQLSAMKEQADLDRKQMEERFASELAGKADAAELDSIKLQASRLTESLEEAEENLQQVIEAQKTVAEAAATSTRLSAVTKLRKVRQSLVDTSAVPEAIAQVDGFIDDFRR